MKLYLTLAQLSVGAGMSEETRRTVLGMTNVKFIGRSELSEERKTASIIGASGNDIAVLPTGSFFARSGRNPAFRFQTRTDLLDDNNSMSEKDWRRLRSQQIEQYYRKKDQHTDRETLGIVVKDDNTAATNSNGRKLI
jgi:hypothetical protein